MSWNGLVKAQTSIQLRLWYNLKIAVHQGNPSNLKELEQFCLEEWEKNPSGQMCQACGDIPQRLVVIAVVIAATGGSTKY